MPRKYRRYDHRLKQLVAESGDIEKIRDLNIPKTTLRQWIRQGAANVVTLPDKWKRRSPLVIAPVVTRVKKLNSKGDRHE